MKADGLAKLWETSMPTLYFYLLPITYHPVYNYFARSSRIRSLDHYNCSGFILDGPWRPMLQHGLSDLDTDGPTTPSCIILDAYHYVTL